MRTGFETLAKARTLRRAMTPPEVALWQRLRVKPNGAPRGRRQHPVGAYVLDFYCPAARLVVEVDGWGHNLGDQPARDERRDAWCKARGLTVVRNPASDVLKDSDAVADGLVRQATELAQRLSPLPRSGRGGGEADGGGS